MRRIVFATICLAVAGVLYAVSPGKAGDNYHEYAISSVPSFLAVLFAGLALFYYLTGAQQVMRRRSVKRRHRRSSRYAEPRQVENVTPIRPRLRAPQRAERFAKEQKARHEVSPHEDWPVPELGRQRPPRCNA
jgi:hypothetical protein